MSAGYVYLIGTPIFGWYKIGKSRTPEVRVKDLGILLPFKLHVIGIWGAKNHHLMESVLHEMYQMNRINGEWFEFSSKEVFNVFSTIPEETRIYPKQTDNHPLDRFSNIEEDLKNNKKVIGVRVQKLRGDFTPEERDSRRNLSVFHQKISKILKKTTTYSCNNSPYYLMCNNPFIKKKLKINIFTSLC